MQKAQKNKKKRKNDQDKVTQPCFLFAPSYLNSLVQSSDISKEIIEPSMIEIKDESKVSSSSIVSDIDSDIGFTTECSVSGDYKYHVKFTRSCVKYISGFAKVSIIKGKININGFSMKQGDSYTVIAPTWLPSLRLFVASSAKSSDTNSGNTIKNPCAIISIETAKPYEMEWMQQADDFSIFSSKIELNQPDRVIMVPDSEEESGILMDTVALGSEEFLKHRRVDCLHLNESWTKAMDIICKRVGLHTSPPRVMICGGKGVGK